MASVTVVTRRKADRQACQGRTKTEAQHKLREILREYEDGQVIRGTGYTVGDTVRDWLDFGLSGRDNSTIVKCTILANTHVSLH